MSKCVYIVHINVHLCLHRFVFIWYAFTSSCVHSNICLHRVAVKVLRVYIELPQDTCKSILHLLWFAFTLSCFPGNMCWRWFASTWIFVYTDFQLFDFHLHWFPFRSIHVHINLHLRGFVFMLICKHFKIRSRVHVKKHLVRLGQVSFFTVNNISIEGVTSFCTFV